MNENELESCTYSDVLKQKVIRRYTKARASILNGVVYNSSSTSYVFKLPKTDIVINFFFKAKVPYSIMNFTDMSKEEVLQEVSDFIKDGNLYNIYDKFPKGGFLQD